MLVSFSEYDAGSRVLVGGSWFQTDFSINFFMYLLRLAARFFFFFFPFPPVLLFLGFPPAWLLAHCFPSLAFCCNERKTQLATLKLHGWMAIGGKQLPSCSKRTTDFIFVCCACGETEHSAAALWNFWQTFDECLSICTDITCWAALEATLVGELWVVPASWFGISQRNIHQHDWAWSDLLSDVCVWDLGGDTEGIEALICFPNHCLSFLCSSPPVLAGSCRGSGRASGGRAGQQLDRRGSRAGPLTPGAWARSRGPAAGCTTLGSPSRELLSAGSRTPPQPCVRSGSVLPLTYQDKGQQGCVKGKNQQTGLCFKTEENPVSC